jgi:hypothetical protein
VGYHGIHGEKQWRVFDTRVVCVEGEGETFRQWVVDRDHEQQTTCMEQLQQADEARENAEHARWLCETTAKDGTE